MILHYPDQAIDKLEEVSYLLKHSPERLSEFLVVDDRRNYEQLALNLQDYLSKISLFYRVSNRSNRYRNLPLKEKLKERKNHLLKKSLLLASFQTFLVTLRCLNGLVLALERLKATGS